MPPVGLPEPTCPGTAPGCVDDWVGAFGRSGAVDGVAGEARFEVISGVTSAGGFVYVLDNQAVRRANIETAEVSTFAGQLNIVGAEDGTGASALFHNPVGITTDGTYLWVADSENFVVRRIEIATQKVTTLTGRLGEAGADDGGPGVASFEEMRDLTYDGRYLYLVESTNNAVRRIDPQTGTVFTVAGGNDKGLSDGLGPLAEFNAPRYIEAIGPRQVFVSDTDNDRPRFCDGSNNDGGGLLFVTSPLGDDPGFQDGIGRSALFRRPRGLAFDGKNLLVADTDNFVIRSVNLGSDTVTTIAGTAGVAGHQVGVGTNAQFDKPFDLHYDAESRALFIAEGSVLRRMYHR
jgi:DNA-binding beta-propeller fold protein YncE